MYCYRGIKYNPQDLNKQEKKASKNSKKGVYRGIKYAEFIQKPVSINEIQNTISKLLELKN